MPYRIYEERVRNYEAAVDPGVVSTKFTNRKPLMVRGQQQAQSEITDFETKVRTLLDENGILGNFRIPYLNFARALYAHKGHQSGLALQKVAGAEKAKFVNMGLDPDILDKISQIVIGVVPY